MQNGSGVSGIKPGRAILKLLVISALFLSAIPLSAEPRIVRVGVFEAAPLVKVGEEGPDGLFIELLEYFAEKKDWKLEWVQKPWSELLVMLQNAEIDILPAVSYTVERTAVYDFTRQPVFIDSGVVFANPDLALHTIFDLKGRKVAALSGSVFTTGFLDYIESFGISCEIILCKDNIEVMKAISEGIADAGVCIYSLGNELAKEFPVVITPISFAPMALHFAVPKNAGSDLLAAIDDLMAPMLNDSESFYSQVFRKWTSQNEPFKLPVWIKALAAFVLTVGALMILWNFTLKRQIGQKTRSLEAEISERKEIARQLQSSLTEKETLIRELYHRTRNTLQTVRGMLLIQAEDYEANDEFLLLVKKTENRIQSMSIVHQLLYSAQDLSRISLNEYVKELSEFLIRDASEGECSVSVDFSIPDAEMLQIDTAIPFGLILNELMTNSLSYAFPDRKEGRIGIMINRLGNGSLILDYGDDGVGVSSGFDLRKQNTLGIRLIIDIVEIQMKGKIIFRNEDGLHYRIEIPEKIYIKRL